MNRLKGCERTEDHTRACRAATPSNWISALRLMSSLRRGVLAAAPENLI
jgi:hypothetical protein